MKAGDSGLVIMVGVLVVLLVPMFLFEMVFPDAYESWRSSVDLFGVTGTCYDITAEDGSAVLCSYMKDTDCGKSFAGCEDGEVHGCVSQYTELQGECGWVRFQRAYHEEELYRTCARCWETGCDRPECKDLMAEFEMESS